MVRIEDTKIVIEVPCHSRVDGVDTWGQLVQMMQMMLSLIQDADGDMLQKDDLFMAIELLRAMLPKFECGGSGSAVSEI